VSCAHKCHCCYLYYCDMCCCCSIPAGNNARMAQTSDKRFSDVVGVDEAKAEVQEIVSYLKVCCCIL
jgi:hypothetical protein